ncbi:hypothetical protein GCM10007148_23800 [Parvularcula lutaonensis]|nr:hypothetical protein GCM10007148_23800 [Parvularcula lutaonensis]
MLREFRRLACAQRTDNTEKKSKKTAHDNTLTIPRPTLSIGKAAFQCRGSVAINDAHALLTGFEQWTNRRYTLTMPFFGKSIA